MSQLLRPVPLPWVERVRMSPSPAAKLLARLLRHRPIAGLATFTLPDNPAVRLVAVDSLLARTLYWHGEGGYEGMETFWWRRFCRSATNILELGANIGYYTVQGAQANPAARYRAVEANPEAAGIIRRNLALNNVGNVEVVAAAVVGEKSTVTVELAFPDQEQYTAPTGAYVRGAAEGVDRPASRSVTVPAVAMPDLIGGVDLLKLDIEGVEAEVLDSVLDTLTTAMPVIFVEVRSHAGRLRGTLSRLHRAGYVVLAVGETSLHLVTAGQLDSGGPLPRYGSRDVILVPGCQVASV